MRGKKEKSELPGESSLFSGGERRGTEQEKSGWNQATLRSLAKDAGATAGRLTFEPGPPRGG